MYFVAFLLVSLVSKSVVSISNTNSSSDFTKVLWELSNLAVQGRQNRPDYQDYYPNAEKYPSYAHYYTPQNQQYGYSQNYPQDYLLNEIQKPLYQYRPLPYPYYPKHPYDSYPFSSKPPFLQKTQESVMDALFSIAQNDDLQCVPKLLCEITSGGLTGRQGGFNLPVNINLESLTAFLSGLNSANMSPVLHFGKAAILGFASKGNSRSCQLSYPQCPNDPDRLVQYLNNHNGGFFRFFQGLNPTKQGNFENYAPQYFNGYGPEHIGKQASAEKRIQNHPSPFVNNDFDREKYYKEYTGPSFSQISYTTPVSYATTRPQKVVFPSSQEEFGNYFTKPGAKTLRFPSELDNNVPYRRGKAFQYDPYLRETNDNFLNIQRPLPNHMPVQNIFPDRTGTGELKLDLEELEQNYEQSAPYNHEQYNQLLYDSFPNDVRKSRPSYFSFPDK